MEVNNRFELLASLPVDEEPEKSSVINVRSPKQKKVINDEQPIKSQWDIPECVEKIIPSAPLVTTTAEISPPIKKMKPTLSKKKSKPIIESTKCEEQKEEVKYESTICSYYPPQPYKFKQTLSSE